MGDGYDPRLTQEAWEAALDDFLIAQRRTQIEKISASVTRVALTAAALAFHQKRLVARGGEGLSARQVMGAIAPKSGLPSDLADLVDDAIRVGYHEVVDAGSDRHVEAVNDLRSALKALQRRLPGG
jgi:hypothetical protein